MTDGFADSRLTTPFSRVERQLRGNGSDSVPPPPVSATGARTSGACVHVSGQAHDQEEKASSGEQPADEV
jgi:hypothetical protein